MAILSLIDQALGEGSGWTVVSDASLKESELRAPVENNLWWGVEIISPPMSSSKKWQSEIVNVSEIVGQHFDLWTHPLTSCHVHVSPGQDPKQQYTIGELVRVAKGALYWEKTLEQLLPHDRRANPYAKANHTAFASRQYAQIESRGWGPVFQAVDVEMRRFPENDIDQKFSFCVRFAGGYIAEENKKYRKERYLSTNLLPFNRQGTVELRRQGGVASAESAIHRVLMALTLHASARYYAFDEHRNRRDHPSVQELIDELSLRIKQLPKTCLGRRFINYLTTGCRDRYSHGPLTEVQVNKIEQGLHNPPARESASSQSQPASRNPTRQGTGSAQPGANRGRGGGSGAPTASQRARSRGPRNDANHSYGSSSDGGRGSRREDVAHDTRHRVMNALDNGRRAGGY